MAHFIEVLNQWFPCKQRMDSADNSFPDDATCVMFKNDWGDRIVFYDTHAQWVCKPFDILPAVKTVRACPNYWDHIAPSDMARLLHATEAVAFLPSKQIVKYILDCTGIPVDRSKLPALERFLKQKREYCPAQISVVHIPTRRATGEAMETIPVYDALRVYFPYTDKALVFPMHRNANVYTTNWVKNYGPDPNFIDDINRIARHRESPEYRQFVKDTMAEYREQVAKKARAKEDARQLQAAIETLAVKSAAAAKSSKKKK